jgi:menaquinone C8-methyltransferase
VISNIAAYVTRREGKKFLKLTREVDDTKINSSMLQSGETLSLYLHIPFCRKLCPFCCFNRYLFQEDKARRYFIDLHKELDMYIERGFSFTDFYFGGGTPTILMDELLMLIDHLKKSFRVKNISVETTPNEMTDKNIDLLKSAGVSRLSLGVQSFDDRALDAMGRKLYTGEEAKEKIRLVTGQFETVNIDLIFNFPFQTVETFRSDVRILKDLNIDQVTFYPLMPSPHKMDAMERKFSQVDNTREKKFYDVIIDEIYRDNFQTSTVWCFSHGKRMIDEYIVDYPDYIGIGAGSVSLINKLFYVNSFPPDNYHDLIQANHLPIVRQRELSRQEYLRYFLLTKLFGTHLNKNKFLKQFDSDIHAALRCELLALKAAGAIDENENEITVNEKGMYIVNVMMREFFGALNSLREYCIENRI